MMSTLHTTAVVIRVATPADRQRIAAMAVALVASRYGRLLTPHPSALDATIDAALDLGVIFVAEVAGRVEGMLALAALPHPLTGIRYADELAWFVEPAHRRSSIGPRLLAQAEAWARDEGLPFLKMIAPADSDVGDFYRKRGYVEVETTFQKTLEGA